MSVIICKLLFDVSIFTAALIAVFCIDTMRPIHLQVAYIGVQTLVSVRTLVVEVVVIQSDTTTFWSGFVL